MLYLCKAVRVVSTCEILATPVGTQQGGQFSCWLGGLASEKQHSERVRLPDQGRQVKHRVGWGNDR